MDIYNVHISELTVGELLDILKSNSLVSDKIELSDKKYVYGLSGLAKILGCSRTHASNIKNSGILDDAIIQNGRKIIVDVELALSLFNKKYD